MVMLGEESSVSLSLLLRVLTLDVHQDLLVLKNLSLKVLNGAAWLWSLALLFASNLLPWKIHRGLWSTSQSTTPGNLFIERPKVLLTGLRLEENT